MNADFPLPHNLPENTIAVALTGSTLYNLAVEGSDMDFVAITTGGKCKQILADGEDLMVTPINKFAERVMTGESVEIMILAGGAIKFLDENYKPFFASLRWSSYKAQERFQCMSHKYLLKALGGNLGKRLPKTMKILARNSVMSRKLFSEGENFNPCLTDAEAKEVFALAKEGYCKINEGASYEELKQLFGIS